MDGRLQEGVGTPIQKETKVDRVTLKEEGMELDYDSSEDEDFFGRISKDEEMEVVEKLPNNIVEMKEVGQDKVLDEAPQEEGDEMEYTIVTPVDVNRGEMEVEDIEDNPTVKVGNKDNREMYLL